MKYLILGAGPTGLTLGCALLNKGIKDFLILEEEEEAGGLCRSAEVDGAPFDTGGGHFLDVKRKRVDEFLFRYLPSDEWNEYERDSKIFIHNTYIGSPIEANIWQLSRDEQVKYLKSIALAGCNLGEPKPEKFTDWICWKLGKRIAENYMFPYNSKMFGENLDQLGTYWLEKLPDVSFDETLLSCLEQKAYGRQPAHAVFLYPKKYGYGEVWKRMASSMGERLICGCKVNKLDLDKKCVNDKYEAENIICTIPWTSIEEISGIGEEIIGDVRREVKYTSIITEYHPENLDTTAHWIYYPDPGLDYHRILVRHNFCEGSAGYWTETNADRYKGDAGSVSFRNTYAYPLNTVNKPRVMERLLKAAAAKGCFGLGRWGEWQHYNSDVVVERALDFADKITDK